VSTEPYALDDVAALRVAHTANPLREDRHDGDIVLAWALSTSSGILTGRTDNVYPKKERPENKIDPAIALIIGARRASGAAACAIDLRRSGDVCHVRELQRVARVIP
jgi:hypothetical protein